MSGGVSKLWQALRRQPVNVQILSWVIAALFTIGAISSAAGTGTQRASSVSAAGVSTATTSAPKPESHPTTTTTAPTTTTESTTTTIPPTTTTAPPATTAPPTTARAAVAPPTTEAPADCTPGYDPCIPPGSSDVDCSSGTGDGPRYVDGPVYVTGPDVYGLDRDGNGVGCE